MLLVYLAAVVELSVLSVFSVVTGFNLFHFSLFSLSPLVHQEFADNLGIPFLETSAKSATNVEQAFMTMAAEIKKRMGPGATAGASEKSNVKIQSKPVNTSSGGCCWDPKEPRPESTPEPTTSLNVTMLHRERKAEREGKKDRKTLTGPVCNCVCSYNTRFPPRPFKVSNRTVSPSIPTAHTGRSFFLTLPKHTHTGKTKCIQFLTVCEVNQWQRTHAYSFSSFLFSYCLPHSSF